MATARKLADAETQSNLPFAYRHYSAEQLREVLRKMYLDPPVRGRRGGQLHARADPRHDASFHRPGSERHGHLHAAHGRRPDHLDASRPRPLHRQGRRRQKDVRRVLRQDDRLLQGPRRLDAHRRRFDGQSRRQRHRRRRHPDRGRRRAFLQAHEDRQGGRLLLRRRREQRGRIPRGAQHGFHLEAAGDLRLREQRLRHVDLDGALDGGEEHRRPRRRLFDAGRHRERQHLLRGRRSLARRGRAGAGRRRSDADRIQDLSLSRAF